MSLCSLLVSDFIEHTGRFELNGKAERYTDYDLYFGAYYSLGLLEDGFKIEPFYKFDLKKFAIFCINKINK